MVYEAQKIYNGHVSVRDYLVKKCIKKKENLVIKIGGQSMTIKWDKLSDPFQFHKTKFKSQYKKGSSYELYDFEFKPDIKGEQLKLF